MEIVRKSRILMEMVKPSYCAMRIQKCPLCGLSILVRFANHPTAVRCIRCGASAITMALVSVLASEGIVVDGAKFYELAARGPLVDYLKSKTGNLTVSEYFDGVSPGDYRDNVQCQDVQKLTFADECFDVVTSTEVFEHVPDDIKGFREVRRVLKADGVFIFTVPLSKMPTTIERAMATSEGIKYLLPAEYHGDAMRGSRGVLVFRDYGRDILDRLSKAGFSSVQIVESKVHHFMGYGSYVLVARPRPV